MPPLGLPRVDQVELNEIRSSEDTGRKREQRCGGGQGSERLQNLSAQGGLSLTVVQWPMFRILLSTGS